MSHNVRYVDSDTQNQRKYRAGRKIRIEKINLDELDQDWDNWDTEDDFGTTRIFR